MKKFKVTSALVAIAVLAVSCDKDTLRQPGNTIGNGSSVTQVVQEQTIISDWFSVSLFPISDRAEFYLEGTQYFNQNVDYDKAQHVELAYVMMPGDLGPVYQRLPIRLAVTTDTRTDEFDFQFLMDHVGFTLTVRNMDPEVIDIDPSITQNFTYRYIVLPKTTFDSYMIDWNNYSEVEQALHL